MEQNKILADLISYYRTQGAPQDQQMLIALLKEVQETENGVLSNESVEVIIESYGLKKPILMALIRRVPALRYEDIPHKLEVCATCRCSGDIRAYIEETYGISSGSAAKEAGFHYRTVNCMKNCKNGPSIKWDGELFSKASVSLLKELIGN